MKRWKSNANLKFLFHLNTCIRIALISLENKDSAGNISTYDVVVNKNWKFRKPKNVDEIFMMLNGNLGVSIGNYFSMRLILNAHHCICDPIGKIEN